MSGIDPHREARRADVGNEATSAARSTPLTQTA
jgi:hypothetical protein